MGSEPPEVAIEVPPTWVPRLTIARDLLDTRVPKGNKKVMYQFSEHETFALFGETSKFDGCIERLAIFSDEEHQCKLEVCALLASCALAVFCSEAHRCKLEVCASLASRALARHGASAGRRHLTPCKRT